MADTVAAAAADTDMEADMDMVQRQQLTWLSQVSIELKTSKLNISSG